MPFKRDARNAGKSGYGRSVVWEYHPRIQFHFLTTEATALKKKNRLFFPMAESPGRPEFTTEDRGRSLAGLIRLPSKPPRFNQYKLQIRGQGTDDELDL
jgi:hypothetical protein